MKLERTQQTASHRRTANTARDNGRRHARTQPLRFTCVDGEGVTVDGVHKYVLLGVGDNQISDPGGLSWPAIFEFLYDNFETGGVAYTGFFLGYDFTQWLKTLPEYQARRLLDKTERAKRKRRVGHNGESLASQEIYFPVDIDGWEFDILSTKRLKLRPEGQSRWMYICDSGAFFQKSFLAVIDPKEWKEPVVSNEEYEQIARGKAGRGTDTLDDSMRYYNRAENAILARVLGQLDTGLRELGINLSPRQWFGPGQAAQAWLDNHGAITTTELQSVAPGSFLEAARASYYGGWFEIMAHGLIPGESYEYDINSAYPYIISQLPCLKHGSYARGTNGTDVPDTGNRRLSLVWADVWSTKSQEVPASHNHYIGSMLRRDEDGNINRPLRTEGWFWLDELQSAKRAKLVSGYEIKEWVSYLPCDCEPPFREVQDIYNLRLKVGKKTPLGIACKLVPNSLYGKFAQSVGNPKYGNPIYASRITSECRRMICDAIATHPKGKSDVLMVATDGVYFRTPHPNLPRNTDLGQWDWTAKSNLCLFKPGVYWDNTARNSIREGTAPIFKARGVNAKYFARQIQAIDDSFAEIIRDRPRQIPWPEVSFNLDFSMVTAIQALARNKWGMAGHISDNTPVKQSSNPSLKRHAYYYDGDIIRSKPPKNFDGPSHSYTKRFGLEDPWSDETSGALGETQDGSAGDLWKEILNP